MTAAETLQQTLIALGLQPALAEVTEYDAPMQLLTLLLHRDQLGREVLLTLRVYEPKAGVRDETLASAVIALKVELPYFAAEAEVMLETIRLLMLLNRTLPIGHYGFREHDGGIDFVYNLMCRDPVTLDAGLLDDVIATIGYYTRVHGDLIEQIVSGSVTCNDVIEELDRALEPNTGAS